ncbi:MAG: FAD-dependent oxidoreductase, partial [Candidatus Humimicrobiaceae bacterium]
IGQITLDDKGYILASEDTKTNIDGVFAAGDIRKKPIKQVITAASDGAVAGIMAERYITAGKFY